MARRMHFRARRSGAGRSGAWRLVLASVLLVAALPLLAVAPAAAESVEGYQGVGISREDPVVETPEQVLPETGAPLGTGAMLGVGLLTVLTGASMLVKGRGRDTE